MVDYVDRARMTTSGGSGTLTLLAAVTGSQAFAAAGVASGDLLEFLVEDFPAWEISTGVYNASGPTVTRTLRVSSSGSLLNVSANGIVTLALTSASMRGVFSNFGRNLFLNARYMVNQRAFTSTTGAFVYTFDHWQTTANNDGFTVSSQTLADSDRTALGDENATTMLQIATTGSSTSGSYSGLRQWVESARRTSNRTLTVSFWAYANGAYTLGFQALQSLGSGGSTAVVAASASFALSTAWQRFSFTFTTPSLSGLTVGAGDALIASFFASSTGVTGTGVGQQTCTINLWGAQLEFGQTATQLEAVDPAVDLLRCQRYYCWINKAYVSGYAFSGGVASVTIALPTTMRTNPTVSFGGTISYSNTTAISSGASSATSVQLSMTVTNVGQAGFQGDINVSAEF